MWTEWVSGRRGLVRIVAVIGALVVGALGYLLRGTVSSSEAALVLVLVVVAAAATGDRWTGILAALAGAAGFDFFLTEPFLDFHISNREDIELAIVLVVVGVAVSELVSWGARQRAVAGEREGYIDGALAIADLAAGGASHDSTADAVAAQLRRVLQVEGVVYVAAPPDADSAVLDRDGLLDVGGITVDARRDGLPIDRFIAIPVVQADGSPGHFRVTSAASLVRVRAEQLRVAVLLADQFSASERVRT